MNKMFCGFAIGGRGSMFVQLGLYVRYRCCYVYIHLYVTVCSQPKTFKIFFAFVSCDILMYRLLCGKFLFEDFRNIVEICKVVFAPSYINIKLNILELFAYRVYIFLEDRLEFEVLAINLLKQ